MNEWCYMILYFRSPYSRSELKSKYRLMAAWLERNFHKINWDYDDVVFSDNVMKALYLQFDIIYTKRLEKTEFVRRFHDDVRTIPEGAPKPSSNCIVNCSHHNLQTKNALYKLVVSTWNSKGYVESRGIWSEKLIVCDRLNTQMRKTKGNTPRTGFTTLSTSSA